MPINDPFDILRRGRSAALPQVPDDPQDDDNSPQQPENAPTTYSLARDQGVQQAAAGFAAQQQQQAAQDAATQKAQAAQEKLDSENQATQAKADAENAKANGVVTQAQTFTGSDGKAYVSQMPTANPDGTTAYAPKDLGIQTDAAGNPYHVSRNQWGAQDWSNPYSAANANFKLTTPKDGQPDGGGQIMAKALGKNAAALPEKDVTDQGVTIGGTMKDAQGNVIKDAQGNPLPDIQVAPNAPINAPQLQPEIDDAEQKLVKAAALQRVKDTIGKDASDAAQAQSDAKDDHDDAQNALLQAKQDAANMGAPGYNFAKAQAAVQAAQDAAAQKKFAYISAGRDAAAKKNLHEQALADPVGFLQQQSNDQSRPPAPASAAPTPSGTAQPSDNAGGASLSSPSAQSSPNPPATGAVPDPGQLSIGGTPLGSPSPSAPSPDAGALNLNQDGSVTPTDPNSITGLITGSYGEKPDAPPGATQEQAPNDGAPPGQKLVAYKSILTGREIDPNSFTGGIVDFARRVDNDLDSTVVSAVAGTVRIASAFGQSQISPAAIIEKTVDGVLGTHTAQDQQDFAKKLGVAADTLDKAGKVAALPVAASTDNSTEAKAAQWTSLGLQSMLGGSSLTARLLQSGGYAVSSGQAARQRVLDEGGTEAAANQAGLTSGAEMAAANFVFGPFSKILSKIPGISSASPTLARMALNTVMGIGAKGVKGGLEFGLINVGSEAANQIALEQSGVANPDAGAKIVKAGLDGLAQGAIIQGGMEVVERGSLEYNNMKVGDALKAQGGKAAIVVQTAHAFQGIDAAAQTGKLTPQQAQAARDAVTSAFTPDVKAILVSHATDASEAQAAALKVMQDGAKQQGRPALPKFSGQSNDDIHQAVAKTAGVAAPDDDLGHLNDDELAKEHDDVSQQVAQHQKAQNPEPQTIRMPDGREVDNPGWSPTKAFDPGVRRLGKPDATPEYQQKVAMELDRRQQANQAVGDFASGPRPDGEAGDLHDEVQRRIANGKVVTQTKSQLNDIANRLVEQTKATQELAQTTEGIETLKKLNAYNATRQGGSKADAITARSAGELAPHSSALEHYLPVSHAIEQLPDPDQQTMATAAIKMTNGRALNSSEQALMFGDPGANTAPAHDATTGQPFASTTNGKPVLTDAGLSRLRALVPAASDILPKSEQAQREAPANQPPAKGKGAQPEAAPLNNGLATQLAGVKGSEPDPDLAKVDDQTLQVQHDNVNAAIARTKEHGGDAPPNAYRQRDKLAAEIARRRSAIAPAETAPIGAKAGAKEGDEIDYSRPNHEGQPVVTRGEVTEVHPDHYQVIDAHDGVERTVPIHAGDEVKPDEQAPNQKEKTTVAMEAQGEAQQQQLANNALQEHAAGKITRIQLNDRLRNLGMSNDEIEQAVQQHGDANLPGIDPATIKPEHQAAAGILSNAFTRFQKLLTNLGLDRFKPTTMPDGTIGLGVNPDDLTHIVVDLPRLAKNIAAIKTPAGRQARVDKVIREEIIHKTGRKILGKNADATYTRIWRAMSPEAQEASLRTYDNGVILPDDPNFQGGEGNRFLRGQTDAQKGEEAIRQMVDMYLDGGKTTEMAGMMTPESRSYFQKIVDYLKGVLTPGDKETANLVKTIGDLVKAHDDHLGDDLDLTPPKDEPPDDGPPVPRMKLPGPMSDEEIEHQEAARKELMAQAFGDRDSLLDVVKKVGGIPTTDPALQGELENVKQGKNKGTMMQFFRKSALPLDRLREALSEKGFHFDTPAEMLDGILNSIRTGKPVYGNEVDQRLSDRIERQVESTGKPPQDLTPGERWAVVSSARHIAGAADGLRKVIGGGEVFGGQEGDEGLTSPRGQHETQPESDQSRQRDEEAARGGSPRAGANLLRASAQKYARSLGSRPEDAGVLARNKLLAASRLRAQQDLDYTDLADRLGKLHEDEGLPDGSGLLGQGVEHQVFYRAGDTRVTKLTKPHEYGVALMGKARPTPESYLDRMALQNQMFGDDMKWDGINGAGQTITSQPYHEPLRDKDGNIVPASYPEIAGVMRRFGFEPTGTYGEWHNATEGVTVADAHPRNFIKAKSGRVYPIDLQIRRDAAVQDQPHPGVFGSAVADHPEVEQPLTKYVSALREGELNLHDPAEFNFAKEYQTDIGRPAPEALVNRARELDAPPGLDEGVTPEDRFDKHLDVADRLASSFHNIHGIEPDDARQVARTALATASDGFDAARGVPFRGYASAVIRNALRDEYRRQTVRSVEQPTLDAPVSRDREGLESTGKDYVRASEPTSSQEAARNDAHARLRNYIDRVSMPDSSREALRGLLSGKTNVEIGQEQGVTPERIGAAAGIGLEKLRSVLAEKKLSRSDFLGGGEIPQDKGYNDEGRVLDRAASDMEEKGWPKPVVYKARQVRDEMERHIDAHDDAQRKLVGGAVSEKEPDFAQDALGFKEPEPSEKPAKPNELAKVWDGVKQILAPHTRGEEAAWTARTWQAKLAEIANKKIALDYAYRKTRQYFRGKDFEKDVLPFIDAIEKGTPISDPALKSIAQHFRETNDAYVQATRDVPSKQWKNYVTNFFPHLFKQSEVDEVGRFFSRKLEGSRAMMKHRTIPTIKEALSIKDEFGNQKFHLESENPVDLFLKRWNQMDKFIAAQHMLNEGKEADVFHERRNPAEILPGEVKIDPKIGYSTEEVPDTEAIEENRKARENPELFPTGRKDRPETMQQYVPLYAPEQAARVLNNYLSPGLMNNDNPAIKGTFKVVMGAGNLLNAAQLGLSAFHLGFTSVDTSVSKLALAMKQVENGQPLDALKSLGGVPFAPFTNLLQGHKLLAELRSPGSQGSEMAILADMASKGGMRAGLDPAYCDQWGKAFLDAIHRHDVLGTLGRAPFAALETVGIPIMQWLVPRQKLGVFADLARFEMAKLGPDASLDDVRKAMSTATASVDNRMGQLAYDNLHMNKIAKDSLLALTRAPGWGIGTVRELGGGYIDMAKYVTNKVRGGDAEFTHRMAYTLALHMLLAGVGTLQGYLMTGKWPESLKDIFYPRTGEKDASGHDVRIANPTYVKDETAYENSVVQTLENKASPLLAILASLYNNKDYYGTQIRNRDDPSWKQALDTAEFAGKEMEPFGFQGGSRFSKATPAAPDDQGPLTKLLGPKTTHALLDAAPFFGMTPAPAYLSNSPAELRASEVEDELHSGDTKNAKEALRDQTKAALREQLVQAGNDPIAQTAAGKAIWAAVQAKTILPKDQAKIYALSQVNNPLQRMVKGIGIDYREKGDLETGYQKIRSIYDKASPAEQMLIYPTMMPLWGEAGKEGADVGPQPPPPKPLASSTAPKPQ